MDHHQRNRQELIQCLDLLTPPLSEVPPAVRGLLVGGFEEGITGGGDELFEERVGLIGHLIRGDVLHPGLLYAHINDIRGHEGQCQITPDTADEKQHRDEHG